MHKHKEMQIAPIGDQLSYVARESYNLLRTNLSFTLMKNGGSGSVVAVTSSCPGEGKSSTSVNLAYTLACAGHKVLLIDGDMRLPSLNEILDVSEHSGLSNILAGQADISVAIPVLTDGLFYIGAGECPPNPSELIGSVAMDTFLAKAREAYDYIIVDTPPVLIASDCLALSKYVDGFLMVVRHGVSRRRDVKEAVKSLRFSGTRVLGFVYNGNTGKQASRYSGYRDRKLATKNKHDTE